ncbi:hypothetical protein B0H16DRAFT_1431546 [Mycena metata]|uniref:Glycosyltransferase family 1 protein n=1 Tax=Mycena metata TaxID=1033252 RepID=A0AAD7MKZ9_9AGAR|nr:hypothetical protein B0H16DRAFT_1431546 [Mycena metata]
MPTHHIAALLPPAWGHVVSYLHIVTQMLKKDTTLGITIVTSALVVGRIDAELVGCTHDEERLRILPFGQKDLPFGPTSFKESFEQVLAGWMETIPRLAQGADGWPKPRTIHFDFFAGGPVFAPTKQILGPDCKFLVWFSAGLGSMTTHLTDYDFGAIAEEIYADESRRENRTKEVILEQVGSAWNGSDKLSGVVVKFPGAPDMYDYERLAYATGPPPPGIGALFSLTHNMCKSVDGFIAVTSTCLEPVAIPFCRQFYKERGQELFAVGMQAHELCWDQTHPIPLSNETIKCFLDKAVSEHGPRSVLYISFGSLYFPVATPGHVEALINTLLNLEQPFPFVLALGGQMASLPQELIDRVNSTGKGLICDFWVEQRAVLQHHSAIGWFLTHGGFNSVSEALVQGIPLILWPCGGEQPINAALFSSGPNPIGIELLQVRAGPAVGPSLRGGPKITGTVEDATAEFKAVFADARGARGATLRANAQKLSEGLKEARAGEAAEELVRLTKF